MNQQQDHLKRSLGFFSAISIVIGTIIGSGIFFKQASVLQSAGNSSLAIAAWIFGGVITLAAGLTIAEIGAQMPYTGGLYVYIENLYGRILGFLAGWMQVIVYGPAIIAAVSGFTGILLANFFNLDSFWRIPLSAACLIAIGALNFLDNKVGAGFSVITTIGKMIPIAAIIIFGIFWGQNNALGQTLNDVKQASGGFGVAVLSTLFAYDGWILIANLGGEMKNPQKVLPKAIILGITIVLIIYTLITVGILRFIPANLIQRLGEDTTAYLANRAFGEIGGRLLTLGIIISMLGTLNGKLITFPRIVYAMAKRNDLPFSRYLTHLTSKGKAPVNATIFIMILATIMLVLFDPDRLSDLCVFTIYCFYVLAFLGIFKLRKINKLNVERPFNTPLYPIVPIVAILGGLFIIYSEILNDPAGVLLFLGTVAIGLPIFFYLKRKESNSDAAPAFEESDDQD